MTSREVTVVIGASSGIGRATARRLAQRGGVLVLADVAPIVPEEFAGAEEIISVRCDVTTPEDVRALSEVASSAGSVRHLVLAAGISPTMGSALAVFGVDLVGPALVVDAFGEVIAPGGAAVLVASMAARFAPEPTPDMGALLLDPLAEGVGEAFIASPLVGDHPGLAYAWAKRGVVQLAARTATLWGRRGVRINSVSPGTIDTPMGQRELAAEPMMSSMLEQTPAGRPGAADEIASVIEFLLSDGASYMTGTDVLVDGGIVAALNL